MAKKSHKKAKDTTGCLPAFIGMFDFRQGRYTRRLLSDKKIAVSVRNKFDVLSNMEEMNEYVNDTQTKNPESSKSSIKALVAKEMSKSEASKNVFSTDKQMLCEMGFEHDMREFFNQDVIGSNASPSASASQGKRIENKGDTEQCIQKALSDITELFSARRSINFEEISSNVEVQQRELMDALEILDLNKDMFLKRLQDPNSVFRKHFVDLQNAHAQEKLNESIAKKSKHRFLTKKDKSDESSSQHLKRIVVLKPSPNIALSSTSSSRTSDNFKNEEETSVFSIKDLKRRLRNMIGESTKKKDLIAMDGVLHRIPYGHQNSKVNNKTSKFSTFFKKGSKNDDVNNHNRTVSSLHQESLYYEAKKRLAEMLNLDASNEVTSPKKVSKPLGKLLSLKEYDMLSPRFSPLRDKEVMQKIKQEDSTCSSSSIVNTDNSLNDHFSKQAKIHDEEDSTHKGSPGFEDSDHPNISLHFSSDVHGSSISGVCEEENSPANSDLGIAEVAKPMTHCVSVSNLEEFSAKSVENDDCPGPVSDLEPNFYDNRSPERVDLITEHHQLSFEEHQLSSEENDDFQTVISPKFAEANTGLCTTITEIKLNYVKAVLEASGLNSYKDLEKSQSLDQLLDPFVFDEVEIIYDELIDDSKLLFDCINEVLLEMKNRYLVSSPWISIIKSNVRPIPVGKNFVKEVCKGVEKYLDIASPYTLDMVIKKDLEIGPWFNVWLQSEGAVFDVGEAILDHILEETILELWD